MSYITQSRRPSAGSMVAVIGIHAALAAALVTGLTVSGALPEEITRFKVRDFTDPPPPPPPPPSDPVPGEPTAPPMMAPRAKLDLKPIEPTVFTTDVIRQLPVPQVETRITLDIPRPEPKPGFDPVVARPKNDPARWLSDNDYRSSWARRDLTGLARFRLEIAADGRVTGCTVTGSTGHAELDEATCTLVSRRARFEPARGSNGQPVTGSYSSSVLWELPE